MRFFKIDGPFHKYGTILFDFLFLNIGWLLLSLLSLGLLMGNATIALYHSLSRSVLTGGRGTFKIAFRKLRQNFTRNLLFTTAGLVIMAVSVLNIYLINSSGGNMGWLIVLFAAVPVYMVIMSPYAIALLAETDLNIKQVVTYSFILSFRHFPYSILFLLIYAVLAVLIYITNFIGLFIFVAPAFAGLAGLLNKKILSGYDFPYTPEEENIEVLPSEQSASTDDMALG